jgi:hypothetical protein
VKIENKLVRPRPRWGDNLKTDLKELGWEDMELRIYICWDLVNMTINLRVAFNSGNFLTRRGIVSLSRRTMPLLVTKLRWLFY